MSGVCGVVERGKEGSINAPSSSQNLPANLPPDEIVHREGANPESGRDFKVCDFERPLLVSIQLFMGPGAR